MRNIIHQYKLRLTNLSQSNRSLKLGKLSPRRDLDLMDAAFADELGANDLLAKIIAGKDVTLLKNLSVNDEKANLLDLRLNKIYREVNTIFEESGAYDLFVGYPWVEGRFLEGNIARCPVMLFPVRLVRDYRKKPRWKLDISPDEDILFNKTFFLAYEKFQRARLSADFWEEQPERFPDVQSFLNYLYELLKKAEVDIHFNQELFEFKLRTLPEMNASMFDNLPVGKLKFKPYAVLGIFPQSDSALIQDYEKLELDPEGLGANTLLRPDWVEPSVKNASPPRENRRHFVTPVDESQEQVLLQVRNGKNVVVHGPPGTGKSQVILNLVADAMAEGKKVLVCSQKRAALDVVYQRLAELGLNRYAALIHDFRVDRAKLFEKIRRQVEDIPQFEQSRINGALAKWEHDFRVDAHQIDEYNTFFEDLYQALTQPRKHGLSAHDLYLATTAGVPAYNLESVVHSFSHTELQDFLRKVGEILDYAEFFNPHYPWSERLSFQSISFERRRKITEDLAALPEQMHELRTQLSQFEHITGKINRPGALQTALSPFINLDSRLDSAEKKQDFALANEKKTKIEFWVSALKKVEAWIEQKKKFTILNDFPGHLLPDLFDHFEVYYEKMNQFFRLLDLNYLKARWYIHEVLEKKGLSATDKEIAQLKKEIETLKLAVKFATETDELPFLTDFPATETAEKQQEWLQKKEYTLESVRIARNIQQWTEWVPKNSNGIWDENGWQSSRSQWKQVQKYAQSLAKWEQQLALSLHPKQIEELLSLLPDPIPCNSYLAQLEKTFGQDFEELRNLDELFGQLATKENNAFQLLSSAFGKDGTIHKSDIIGKIRQAFYLFWIEKAEEETPILKEVSQRRIHQRIFDYAEKVKARQKAVAGLVDRKMKDRIVDGQSYNRLNNPITYRGIHHQVSKKRLLWTVRKLVQEYWEESLATLIPCWLASPESVAALFPMEKGFFDLVIFDEASQCFVERAVPVLLRGKNAVVAGDEKQLPPFDLYSIKAEEEDAAFFENEIALEVKSILDLARTSFTDCHLTWHYRSQEEELINFSNHAFYEGRLNVMPPAEHNPTFKPIEWIDAGGIWSANRNQLEAEKVVELVEQLVQDPQKPSIGIVTFNFHQQEAIRDHFETRLSALTAQNDTKILPELLSAMEKGEGEERQGIFIKNIENVQGDERDIIIFSVGYAKDAYGKLVSQFGLLNQEGGENRLNVAITRAKRKIYVVCSFQPEQLRVEEAKHPGPKLLKQYLTYALAVSRKDEKTTNAILNQVSPAVTEAFDNPAIHIRTLADKVADRLIEKGLSIARNIGETNYKVEIAIRKPNQPGAFLLGIECEDDVYFSGRSPKEREIYRWNLLEKRGWRMHRVWSRNFYLDPEKEIEKILSLLENPDTGTSSK